MLDPSNPPEEYIQRTVAAWLDMHGILWFHAPNEGEHKVQYRAKQLQLGLRPGVPDIIILDPPPAKPRCRGVALELKRKYGSRVADRQQWWIDELVARGWYAAVCYGIDHALRTLNELGYGQFRGKFLRPYPIARSRTRRKATGAAAPP